MNHDEAIRAIGPTWTTDLCGTLVSLGPERLRTCSLPDVPWVGQSYGVSCPDLRVALVGKANYRWPPPRIAGYDGHAGDLAARLVDPQQLLVDMQGVSSAFRGDRIPRTLRGDADTPYPSPWWRFLGSAWLALSSNQPLRPWKEVCREHELRARAAECLSHCLTTNIFKVGRARGNPDRKLRDAIELPSLNLLRLELETARPNVVLCPVGEDGTYDGYLERALDVSFEPTGVPGVRRAKLPKVTSAGFPWGGVAVRFRHPQGARNDALAVAVDEVRCALAA